MTRKYKAAHIDVQIKVQAYRDGQEVGNPQIFAQREVTLNLRETFTDDSEPEQAVAALAATILEAARR